MTTAGYVHADADFESEQARLTLLEVRYDAGTIRRLERLGPLGGARCLEVGAGAGSVARWLSGAVGPGGRVVATDVDPRFLDKLGGPNVEVRRHDILVDAIEESVYDLVHCRALLLHLPDPARALERMVSALRPGGIMLVEDTDFVSLAAADPIHRSGPAFDRATTAVIGYLDSTGHVDPWLGRRLPGLVARSGLAGVQFETTLTVRRGASAEALLLHQSTARFGPEFLATGVVSEPDLDEMQRALTDPSFTFVDAVSVAAWGRRAV